MEPDNELVTTGTLLAKYVAGRVLELYADFSLSLIESCRGEGGEGEGGDETKEGERERGRKRRKRREKRKKGNVI